MAIVLSSIVLVWSVQQVWRWGTCYSELIERGWPATQETLWQAWRWRCYSPPCQAVLWWALSVWAVCGVHWALWWEGPALESNRFFYWLCLLAVPGVLIGLARIDARVYLLPDPLIIMWAGLGAIQALCLGHWMWWEAVLGWGGFGLWVWGGTWLLQGVVMQRWVQRVFQWLGAGDIKFLCAALFWLSKSQIVLMWVYAAAFCWLYHGWQQRRWLPRGYGALGPHLILGWWVTKWVHPAVQYGLFY